MTATIDAVTIPGYVAGTWEIDADHSEVAFAVRHMMLSKVRGRFTAFRGTIITGESPEASSVSADIEMQSITTGNEQRDGHLRSPEFFATDDHPEMTFRSTAIRQVGGGWLISGDLTIKGVTKSVELKTDLLGIGPDAFGGTRAGFVATTSINRHDFAVNWNAAIEGGGVVVGEKVDITLDIQAVLQTS